MITYTIFIYIVYIPYPSATVRIFISKKNIKCIQSIHSDVTVQNEQEFSHKSLSSTNPPNEHRLGLI